MHHRTYVNHLLLIQLLTYEPCTYTLFLSYLIFRQVRVVAIKCFQETMCSKNKSIYGGVYISI